MGILYIKAELLKVIQSVRGINRAYHTKKNRVKDDFLGLTMNLELFLRGLCPGRVPSQYLTLTRCISLMLIFSSWMRAGYQGPADQEGNLAS